MAADIQRAQRIRQIKDERPGLTWRSIADACGVSERSAHHWQKDGKISYSHAKLLAQYADVDLDWLWRGPQERPKEKTPQMDRIEHKLDKILKTLSRWD